MLETAAVVLVILWALGFLGVGGVNVAVGAWLHLLLLVALVVVLFRVIQGRTP